MRSHIQWRTLPSQWQPHDACGCHSLTHTMCACNPLLQSPADCPTSSPASQFLRCVSFFPRPSRILLPLCAPHAAMAMLVRGAVAAVAAVGVSSGASTQQAPHSSSGVLACRRSAFCRGASPRLSWARCQVRGRRAAGAVRITNVAAPVKEQETSTEVGFSLLFSNSISVFELLILFL